MKKQAINERIHQGFRAWLLELGIRATKTDFGRIGEGRKTAAKLEELITAWEQKFLLESQLFFPALALEAPYSVALLDEEKRMVESKCRQVSRIIRQYLQPGLPLHYVSTGKALREAFSSLSALLFSYMNHQDGLFRAAAGTSRDANRVWGDVDAVLLQETNKPLPPYPFLVNEQSFPEATDDAKYPVTWGLWCVKEDTPVQLSYAGISGRHVVSQA